MRLLILLAGVLLATNATADDQPKQVSVTKELDKSSPQIMAAPDSSDEGQSEDKADQPQTRAQDYNSSRSNTTTVIALDDDDDGDSIATDEACSDAVDNDCTGEKDETPANHNTTRQKR